MTKKLWKRAENHDQKNSFRNDLPRSPDQPKGAGEPLPEDDEQ